MKKVWATLISSNQTAHLKNRFIRESEKLISDILELRNALNTDGFLVTVNIKKAFNFVNHSFLILVSEDFLTWIQILLNNQESKVTNGGTTSTIGGQMFHQ